MEFKTFTDGKGRAVLVDPSSKDITIKKVGYNTYTTILPEELDFIIESINTVINSREAKHYYYYNRDNDYYSSAVVVLGSLLISIDSSSIYIYDYFSFSSLDLANSNLNETMKIFNKFLEFYNVE